MERLWVCPDQPAGKMTSHGRMDGQRDGWRDGGTDGWIDRLTDGWMDVIVFYSL